MLSQHALPLEGPVIVQIPTLSGTAIGAGATGPVIKYKWPRNWLLRAMLFFPKSALKVDAANLLLRMVDDDGKELISDGLQVAALSNFVPSLALHGVSPVGLWPITWQPRPFVLERVVRAGEQWLFQVANSSGGTTIIPYLDFWVERVKL